MEACHAIRQLTVGAVYCTCGWDWHNPRLKGKSDLDLEAENQKRFEKHRKLKIRAARQKRHRRRLQALRRKKAK